MDVFCNAHACPHHEIKCIFSEVDIYLGGLTYRIATREYSDSRQNLLVDFANSGQLTDK